MSDLVIKISGEAKTGKSTVGRIIKNVLAENGFEVKLLEEDHPDRSDEHFSRCVAALSEQNLKVKIYTEHIMRNNFNG